MVTGRSGTSVSRGVTKRWTRPRNKENFFILNFCYFLVNHKIHEIFQPRKLPTIQ